jgi:LuxR family maltose regulon positive regulatory protein
MDAGLTGSIPLLTTKVHIPQQAGTEITRIRLQRIIEKLLEPGCRVLLVSAPAGFGKSTLLGRWREVCSGASFSWLTLDPDDNDAARFWSYVAFAIRQEYPSFGAPALHALSSVPMPPTSGAASVRSALTLMLNELAALPGQPVLVLDDFHHVTSPSILADVAYAVEHWPANARLVVSTRMDPALPVSRLRAAGLLIELRAGDLRFTAEETAEFLQSSVELPLEPDQVRVIDTRMEGWIAGLKMTALAMRGAADAHTVVQNLSENPPLVLDYLAEEVLERQEKQVQEFLVLTSSLDRFCSSLCDAVTERRDSSDLLNEIRRRNLFLIPLDERGCWFRYHPLLADLLRARLVRNQADLVPLLHRRASEWFDANALPDEAVHHALAVPDMPRAVELVVRHSRALIWTGWSATVLRWLGAIPEELVQDDLRLIVSRCWVNCFVDRWHPMKADLDRAEALLAGSAPPWGGAVVSDELGRQIRHNSRITVAILRAFVAFREGDLQPAQELARRAVQVTEDGPPDLLGAALTILGQVLKETGPIEEAQGAFLRAGPLFLARQNLTAWALSVHEHVDILLSRGLLAEAGRVSEEALLLLRERGALRLPAAGHLFVAAAEIAWRRNELEPARAFWSSAAESGELSADSVVSGYSSLGQARLAAVRGRLREALDLLRPAEEIARTCGSKSFLNDVEALRARLWSRCGDAEQIGRLQKVARQVLSGPVSTAEGLVRLRSLIDLGDPSAAAKLAPKLLEEARSAGRMGLVPDILVLQARASWLQGQKEAALTVLRQALEIAAPEQALRAFLDEGEELREPLADLRLGYGNAGAAPGSRPAAARRLLQKVLDAIGPECTGTRQGASPAEADGGTETVGTPAEALTAREREVLGLLAAGLSNQQIAERLFVSLATVKKHVSAVLVKLGADNRTRAAALGRLRGLL